MDTVVELVVKSTTLGSSPVVMGEALVMEGVIVGSDGESSVVALGAIRDRQTAHQFLATVYSGIPKCT